VAAEVWSRPSMLECPEEASVVVLPRSVVLPPLPISPVWPR
jgi:hypothetical protein